MQKKGGARLPRHPLNPPLVSEVFDFLHDLFKQGLEHSAINSHRSALDSILQVPGVERISEHILVSRFMKGVFNLRPPQPCYSKMWDIDKVLIYLNELGRNEDLTLQQLTLKTAKLLPILQEDDCIFYTNWKLLKWIFLMLEEK